jgi:hypothetical protein
MFPEQERALRYVQLKGTEAPARDVIQRLTDTYAAVDAMVAGIDDVTARAHHATSGWCILEVVDHLIQSDAPAVEQLSSLLAGDEVTRAIPASLQSADPHSLAWAQLKEQLVAVHAQVRDVLATADDATSLHATAPVRMVVKCAGADGTVRAVEWEQRFDWKAYAILVHAHNREHMAQIQRILA